MVVASIASQTKLWIHKGKVCYRLKLSSHQDPDPAMRDLDLINNPAKLLKIKETWLLENTACLCLSCLLDTNNETGDETKMTPFHLTEELNRLKLDEAKTQAENRAKPLQLPEEPRRFILDEAEPMTNT